MKAKLTNNGIIHYIFLLALGMTFLSILLYWQYRSFCVATEKIVLQQNNYRSYVDAMRKALRGHKIDIKELDESAEESQNDEMEEDSFLVINRQADYLRESTVSYLKEQQLDSLMAQMNFHELRNYTDQLMHERNDSSPKNRKKIRKNPPSYKTWRATVPRKGMAKNSRFIWPIEQSLFWLSSFYGPRKKPSGKWGFHYGIDMAAHRGTPVHAADDGVVELSGYTSGYGNNIIIKHDGPYKTRYAHLDRIFVRNGQKIAKKQKIGAVGDTGFTIKSGKDASHLHLEIFENGKHVNPLYFLPA